MASLVTHLIIADEIMKRVPRLDRRGFCVGSIAPDCNVENKDWTAYKPPKSVTHWMTGSRKTPGDADRFCEECIAKRREEIDSAEKYAFLLGYYAHLLTDGAYERMTRTKPGFGRPGRGSGRMKCCEGSLRECRKAGTPSRPWSPDGRSNAASSGSRGCIFKRTRIRAI